MSLTVATLISARLRVTSMSFRVDGRKSVIVTFEPGLPLSLSIASGMEMLRAFLPSIFTMRSPDMTPAS